MLVVSALAGDEAPRAQGLRELTAILGPLVFLSQCVPFDRTDYYAEEMGSPLTRRLAGFAQPLDPLRLAEVKTTCLGLEKRLADQGRRRVNLDPGLLGPGSLTLASSKPSPHRLALAPGIFAEVTLLYQRGEWKALPWTYPDYASQPISDILLCLRRRYLWQLKQSREKEG
jgi:hypothetical protein